MNTEIDKKEAPADAVSADSADGSQDGIVEDAVFGTITKDGPNYRNVGWIRTSILMMKTQIGLGVLSIPYCFNILGLVPGTICLLVIAGITTWSNYIVGVFKLNHREVYGIDDAVYLMFGPVGKEIFGFGFAIYLIALASSSLVAISIGFNAVSTHGACTAIFIAVAAIGVMLLSSVRTLSRVSILAWIGLTCIFVAITTVTIAVGVQSRPEAAPPGPWKSDYKIIGTPTVTEAISAISSFVFSFAGTPYFFPIIAEMREPRHYTKAMLLCQSVVTVTYIVIGIVVYYFCGSYVTSPALGSAGKTIKMISYGIAIPGIYISAGLTTHLASKFFLLRILRGSKHLVSNTLVHWGTWIGCILAVVLAEYLIASGVPNFGDLVSLIGALLGTLQSFQPFACMWLFDNWSKGKAQRSPKWMAMVAWSAFVIISGTFLMIYGTYCAIIEIIDSFKDGGSTRPWSCHDNSHSA